MIFKIKITYKAYIYTSILKNMLKLYANVNSMVIDLAELIII